MAEQRRQEIEAKRAKLNELRRARDERKAQLAQAEAGPSQPVPLSSASKDVNDLVDSLLQARPGSPYTPSGRGTPLPARAPSALGRRVSTPPPLHSGSVASVPATPGGGGGRISRLSEGSGAGRRDFAKDGSTPDASQVDAVDYVDHSAELYELPSKALAQAKPAPAVTYSKSTQTADTGVGPGPASEDEDEADAALAKPGMRDGGAGRETEEEMRKRILDEIERERREVESELHELERKDVAEISDDQRQAIFAAPDFSAFVEESTRIVQRALSDGYDYIKDYTIGLDGAFDDEGQRVKPFCTFEYSLTEGRSVTGLDWSAKYPELLAASYNKNPSAPNDPEGIVAVWNLHLLERPEFVFHSPSDVLSVSFSPFHPSLVFGGTYSGQVLLWDTRAKQLPVLKTPLSASGHTYPIYAMKMVGTQNANSLVSSSTDGLVCSWLADMLAQPQETLPLSVPNNKNDEVSITSLDFSPSDTATFWIGTEEGSIHSVGRYDQPSRKAGINDDYRAHAGAVTGLHFHSSAGNLDFGDLFLSSSVDWSVKLWRAPKSASTAAAASAGAGGASREHRVPLHSFESADDYVYDVKWHPHHPALFGSVDGAGKFDLWNLNTDVEVPIISTQVCSRALNKLAFDKSAQGRKAAMGGADGRVYVYDLAEKMVVPRDGEWVEMQRVLQGLQGREGGVGAGLGEREKEGRDRDRDRERYRS